MTDVLSQMAEAASLAPSIHNSQPWSFRVDGERLEVSIDATRATPAMDPVGRGLRIACAAAALNALVVARAAGRACAVSLGPVRGRPELAATLTLGGTITPDSDDLALARAVPPAAHGAYGLRRRTGLGPAHRPAPGRRRAGRCLDARRQPGRGRCRAGRDDPDSRGRRAGRTRPTARARGVDPYRRRRSGRHPDQPAAGARQRQPRRRHPGTGLPARRGSPACAGVRGAAGCRAAAAGHHRHRRGHRESTGCTPAWPCSGCGSRPPPLASAPAP